MVKIKFLKFYFTTYKQIFCERGWMKWTEINFDLLYSFKIYTQRV